MRSKLTVAFMLTAFLALIGMPAAAIAAVSLSSSFSVDAPGQVPVGQLAAVTLHLPPNVAAVDGRILFPFGSASLIGVAPEGPGTGLRPVDLAFGSAFGAYGMSPNGGSATVQLVFVPEEAARITAVVILDDAADPAGNRVATDGMIAFATIVAGDGRGSLSAPGFTRRAGTPRLGSRIHDLFNDGQINVRDLDNARGAWDATEGLGTSCSGISAADVNNDGCTDIVDLQAIAANETQAPVSQSRGLLAVPQAIAHTFTVTSNGDGADANPGDAICATTGGVCTLRAAMTEAEYSLGDDRIEFNIPGVAPVRIQIGSRLPMITSRSGGMIIDGYTEPGSHPNTAQTGSNAVQGIEVRGNGNNAREVGFYITSANNVIRGLQLTNLYRPMFVDGTNATNNSIVGNFIGFNTNGSSAAGQYGLILNTGANGNHIGTSALADRNVIGYAGIDNYGPGTNGNVFQGNQVCILPNGNAATCSTGLDHNFGPKNDLIGGTNPGEGNVFGPSTLQCVEYSHGWDPNGHVYSDTYAISGGHVVGNWLGFRADGSYNANFRCGLNFSNSDNGNGINVYDGSVNNLIENNFVASVYDGIQVQSPNASGNIVRNNTIGVSPLGQAAPLTRWGIIVRWGTTDVTVQGNTIRNAAAGGIGLITTNNSGTATSPAFNIRLTQNIVSDTNGQGIDLVGMSGPDPNDPGDADTGPNTLLNTPVITSASTVSVAGTAQAGATVEVYRASRNAGQYGLPIAYLGSTVANGSGGWSLPVSSLSTDRVTALQILPDNNTSELSVNVGVHVNTKPVVDSVTISPTGPTTNQTLTATVTSHDADGDAVTTSYQWALNGTDIPGATSQTLNLATAGNGDKGDLITVRATVNDGQATSDPVTSSPVTVANTAPTATVTLTPANPSTTATLTATATRADDDGDTVTLTYVWKVNGTAVKTTANSAALTDTLDLSAPGNGDPGDVVSVEVTPNDGAASGTLVSASQTVVAGPTVYATDSFTRTASSSWGTAPTGGPYALTGTAADFAVNGSAGTINLTAGANRAASLTSVSVQDVDLSFRVAASKVPAGGNLYVYGIARRVSSTAEYRAKVRIATNGAVFIQATSVTNNVESAIGSEVQVAGLTATPGAYIWIRAQLQGASPTTIRMRAWADGSAEPGTWQYTQTNTTAGLQAPGAVGVRAYLGSSTTNAPIVLSFDDLSATSIAP